MNTAAIQESGDCLTESATAEPLPQAAEASDDSALRAFAEESHTVIIQLLSFVAHLQRAAIQPLSNQQRSNGEVENRKGELTSIIAHVTDEVSQGVQAVQTIQQNLMRGTERNLELISEDLSGAREILLERQTALSSVMRELDTIGRQLSMLAMNAKIEASRAGESEAGFSVVADEVKRLARTAIEHSAQASSLFDLSSVTNKMSHVVDNYQDASKRTETEINKAFEDVMNAFSEVDGSLGDLSNHYSIITEVTNGTDANVDRSRNKMSWANQRVEEAIKLLSTHTLEERAKSIARQLLRDGVHVDKNHDRLESIRSTRKLRVAIEPSFVGLSFRQTGDTSLTGLDVEYAKALARHLKVECEFVEAPWDTLTELLYSGRHPDEPPADLVLSALPPSDTYEGVAYSETYTYLNWVLARQTGNTDVKSLSDLNGKTLGIINDPGAFDLLQKMGVRWQANQNVPDGKVFLKELIAYSDQTRIHDCLAEGVVDGFCVDLPIYHWACSDKTSPWNGKIEICSGNLADDPYYYCVAVASVASSYTLLQEVNSFIEGYVKSAERLAIERLWQGEPVNHTLSYRDEPGNLLGEAELRHLWVAHNKNTASTSSV